jgi:hypothetical protein
VRRDQAGERRRGVVFLKQIVPRPSEALGPLSTRDVIGTETGQDVQEGEQGAIAYDWFAANRWNRLSALRAGPRTTPAEHSIEEFITNRPWAYARRRNGSSMEFRIEQGPSEIWPAIQPQLDCDIASIFGAEFIRILSAPPISTFVAVGSSVRVAEIGDLENW